MGVKKQIIRKLPEAIFLLFVVMETMWRTCVTSFISICGILRKL